MREQDSLVKTTDWLIILLYVVMVTFGWLNIYAAVYDPEVEKGIFDFSINSGKQLWWIGSGILLIIGIMVLDFRFYESNFAYIIYGLALFALILVLLFGREVQGNQSWLVVGPIRLQPSEITKVAVALTLANYLSDPTIRLRKFSEMAIAFAIIAAPVGLILLQGDAGSAIVFSIFIFVLYREGLPSIFLSLGFTAVFLFLITLFFQENYFWYIIAGIGALGAIVAGLLPKNLRNLLSVIGFTVLAILFVFSVEFIVDHVLKERHRKRIEILLDPDADPMGYGWQVTQSKIAIGSGGLFGKGFLDGTQTKFDFVPDQSTDFIFCTVGEEHGWIGSAVLVVLFMLLIYRIIYLAERQKSRFARVYGYCVACIFFFHFSINIGMTIGLFPVIGIPLPFFSYGGSSLWAFTILLFILIKLDAHRMQILAR